MAKKKKESYRFKSFEGSFENGRHLRITMNMMESVAWQELSSYAIHVYLLLKIKYKGDNAEDLSLTYEEGMQYMSQRRFTQALDELIDHGFIRIVKHRQNTRECNIYGLSDMWQHYLTDKFEVSSRLKKKPGSTGRLGKRNDTS